jgi:putative transposase
MRKSRFTDEQVVGIIREADRDPVGEVAKCHAISEQTIYPWRKRFGELRSEDVRRLRQLETENARLKKLVAELDLKSKRPASRPCFTHWERCSVAAWLIEMRQPH